MPAGLRPIGHLGQLESADAGELPLIFFCRGSAGGVPAIEARELDLQHRRLQCVEPAVDADQLVAVFVGAPVIGEHADLLCQLPIVRCNGAAVPVGAKVLARVEAEAGDGAEARTLAPTGTAAP